jgi:phosphoesterase RecJ-like protein
MRRMDMGAKPEIAAGLARAAEVIAGARSLVVTGHVNPDGDALGSALGLALAAKQVGIRAAAAFGGGFELPEHFAFLDTSPLAAPVDVDPQPDVLVSFDVGTLDRIGEVAGIAAGATQVVMIDHHASTTGFGDINVNDPAAGASAQLCYYLLEILGWDITPQVATALHTGVVTDTGRFQYSNASPEVLRVGAALVEAGARPEVVGQHVYESVPFGYLGVEAAVLGRATLEPELRFVWSVLELSDIKRHGIGMDDVDGLIDAVRIAREADVAALVKEDFDGGVKVSLRSRGRVDVGAIAVSMAGGGHHNAAGFSHPGPPAAAIAEVRARL